MQPTALVHEAYVRLVDQTRVNWQNRAHFYGIASSMMRRVEAPDRNAELAGLNLMSLTHAKTNRPASANAFLTEALTLFNSLPDELKHHDNGLSGEALIEMKREAEARVLLSKRYEYLTRTYGE